MAAASDGMFESSARSDWPLKSLKLKALIPREGVAKSGLNFQPSLHPQHPPTQTAAAKSEETAASSD